MARDDMPCTANGSGKSRSNLVGIQSGYFTVIGELPPRIRRNGKKVRVWDCVCVCGEHRALSRGEILKHKRKSCGCMASELSRRNNTVHGDSHTRLHNIWSGMRERCYTKTDHHYPGYGGRGIVICEEWRTSYPAFRDWSIANGYSEGLSIDRIDNDGPYSPENCRWTDQRTQCNNTRRNHIVAIGEDRKTISEWSRISGIASTTIRKRLRLGCPPEDAVFKRIARGGGGRA